MKFSICHTTARPNAWGSAYAAWMQNAAHPENVEYVLVVDQRWGFKDLPKLRAQDKVLWNTGRKCFVDGANIAAAASTGDVLILNADDIFPCLDWDVKLEDAVRKWGRQGKADFVIHTGSNSSADNRDLMVTFILSRARYARLGYAVYPGYESMYADDDFGEHARLDGCVIDARHIVFEHRHYTEGRAKEDEVYRHENRTESYSVGKQLLIERRANGFQPTDTPSKNIPSPKVIAVCLPGIQFSQHWVATWTELFGKLMATHIVHPIFCYSTNVYATRIAIADMVLKCSPKPDYVLWIDDDNLVNSEHVRQLINDLDQHLELDGVSGWCWVLSNVGDTVDTTSIGEFTASGSAKMLNYAQLMSGPSDLKPYDCGGFPCILMRRSVIEKVTPKSFTPIISDAHHWGFCGEDIAFFTAAREKGLQFAVDRRVKVPHLRLGSPEPPEMVRELEQQRQEQVRVA